MCGIECEPSHTCTVQSASAVVKYVSDSHLWILCAREGEMVVRDSLLCACSYYTFLVPSLPVCVCVCVYVCVSVSVSVHVYVLR